VTEFIPRDEARELVAQAFYGDCLIRFTEAEWQLNQLRGPQHMWRGGIDIIPPWALDIDEALIKAIGRVAACAAQGRTVDEWLALFGFDPSSGKFDRCAFLASFAGPMGTAIREERARWSRADVKQIEQPVPKSTMQDKPQRRRGGARAKFDWEAIEKRVHELMDKHGEWAPTRHGWNAQARLEEMICDPDSGPEISTLREKLPEMLERWRAARKSSAVSNHSDHVEAK
jgi:hypothetical protein